MKARISTAAVMSVATLLVVLPALGVLGTLLYRVPYAGLATAFVPWYLPPVVGAALIGGRSRCSAGAGTGAASPLC